MQLDKKFDLQRFSKNAGSEVTGEKETSEPDAEASQEELSFEALLKSHPAYKAAYDAKVKKAIEGRFRQMKELEARQEQLAPVLEALAKRYGQQWTPETSPEEILLALQQDTPDRERELEKLQDQVTAIQSIYPDFRLDEEMRNPAFGMLAAEGVPLPYAYELAHRQDAIASAMGYAISRTRQALTDQMLSGHLRPQENGLDPRISGAEAPDPRNMTAGERKALRAKVARGEKVYW